MKRSVSTLTAVVATMSIFMLSSGATSASALAALPTCSPSQLTVTAGKWIAEASIQGTAEEWLPISITNGGSVCGFVGVPKIIPTGVKRSQKSGSGKGDAVVEAAAIDTAQYTMLVLAHREVAYTYLRLEYRISPVATANKWITSCKPATASGFHITVGPAGHVLSRNVKVSFPEVCTTGKANDLHTARLSLAPLNP